MPITIPIYPLDLTGKKISNRISGEYHELPEGRHRAVVAEFGSFYSSSMVVRDENGFKLDVGEDVDIILYYEEPSKLSGKEVCTGVSIRGHVDTTSVTLNYQAVGGQYESLGPVIVKTIANVGVLDQIPVKFSDIIDKPDKFKPEYHLHLLNEVSGFNTIINVLDNLYRKILSKNNEVDARLETTIEQLLTNHKDEINQLISNHQTEFNNLSQEFTNLQNEFSTYETNINTSFTQHQTYVDGELSGYQSTLNSYPLTDFIRTDTDIVINYSLTANEIYEGGNRAATQTYVDTAVNDILNSDLDLVDFTYLENYFYATNIVESSIVDVNNSKQLNTDYFVKLDGSIYEEYRYPVNPYLDDYSFIDKINVFEDISAINVSAPIFDNYSSYEHIASAVQYTPDGTQLYIAYRNEVSAPEKLAIADATTYELIADPYPPIHSDIDVINSINFSPDGSLVAFTHSLVDGSTDSTISIYETATWTRVATSVDFSYNSVNYDFTDSEGVRAEFSPLGSYLIYHNRRSTANIYDTTNWSLVLTVDTTSSYDYYRVKTVFSDDESKLVNIINSGIEIYETVDWTLETTLDRSDYSFIKSPFHVMSLPNTNNVLIINGDTTDRHQRLVLLDIVTLESSYPLDNGQDHYIRFDSFSPRLSTPVLLTNNNKYLLFIYTPFANGERKDVTVVRLEDWKVVNEKTMGPHSPEEYEVVDISSDDAHITGSNGIAELNYYPAYRTPVIPAEIPDYFTKYLKYK